MMFSSSRYGVWTMVLLGLLACQGCWATDKPAEAADKVDKPATSPSTAAAATSTPQDLGIPQNLLNILTNGGAVAVGLAVVAALAALAMPMFGLKYCQLLGNCDSTAYPYANTAVYQNDVYGQYPQTSYPTGNTYQKRSIDYMGPVLQMLKTAYDKYGQQSLASRKTS